MAILGHRRKRSSCAQSCPFASVNGDRVCHEVLRKKHHNKSSLTEWAMGVNVALLIGPCGLGHSVLGTRRRDQRTNLESTSAQDRSSTTRERVSARRA